jgi:restriction system protein
VQAYKQSKAEKKKQLIEVRAAHASKVARIKTAAAAQHAQVDRIKAELASGKPDAIVSYFSAALERSLYSDTFPQQMRIAYVPESKQLVIEYDLPGIQVVPSVKEYKYIKSKDAISEVMRPVSDRKRIYTGVVCQVTIRTLHEIFETDHLRHVDTVVFNGHVRSIDAATGKDVHPCII